MQAVTVVSPETKLYRIRIQSVFGADLQVGGQKGMYFEGNFDNFRTFRSSKQDEDSSSPRPVWSSYEVTFTYETTLPHLLLAKLLTITLYIDDEIGDEVFMGEATTDLLHLALGPSTVCLSVKNGDVDVGDLCFTCEMEEVAEVEAHMKEFEVEVINLNKVQSSISRLELAVETKAKSANRRNLRYPNEVKSTTTARWVNNGIDFFGTTGEDLMQAAGLRFYLTQDGDTVARGMILFISHFDERKLSEYAKPEFVYSKEQRCLSADVFFDHVRMIDEVSGEEVARISGLVHLRNLPSFAQMYAGTNVNGRIYNGKRISPFFPLPPNVCEEA